MRLRVQLGDSRAGEPGRRERAELVAALSAAAGMPAVVAAVARAHRRRGALATGVPWLAWLRRLRPDPLRRLGLGDRPQEDVRTSLPQATPVQRAQVDSAVRSLATASTDGLPEPWPALARAAATRRGDEVAERLDRAVAGTDLAMRSPRWWSAGRGVQRALALATAVGASWLLALAAAGYLRLDDELPTPDLLGVPAPTLLLLGGLLASFVVALLLGAFNRAGAARRAARARRALDQRVATVGEELVLAPLREELAAHDRLRELVAPRGRHR